MGMGDYTFGSWLFRIIVLAIAGAILVVSRILKSDPDGEYALTKEFTEEFESFDEDEERLIEETQ